jgi:hypothetical protein
MWCSVKRIPPLQTVLFLPMNTLRAGLLAGVCCLVLATRVFVAFDSVRIKVVEAPVAAIAGVVRVGTTGKRVNGLRPPFALIARIRHDSTGEQVFSIRVAGRTVCNPTVRGRATRRIDCVVAEGWDHTIDHDVTIEGPLIPWTLDYLELATHHGNSTGVLNLFVLPAASDRYAPPGPGSFLLGLTLTGLLLLPRASLTSGPMSFIYGAITALVATLFTLVLIAPIVSPYRIVLSAWTYAGWTCLLQGQVIASWVQRAANTIWHARGVPDRRLAWALSVAVCALGVARGSRALGVADTYGYVSQADLWLRGNLKIDQSFAKEAPWPQPAWTFAPLGYRPHPPDDRMIVPSYPPGLPMLLALTKRLGGQDAMFCVVPLSAGLLILATYGLGRRLGSGVVGMTGAWLVATSPVVLAHTMTAMTDVPVAAAWAAAFYLLLGTTTSSAAGAGLLSAVATLIRPNLAPLAAALGLHYIFRIRNPEVGRRGAWHLLVFGLAALPGPITVAAIHQHLFGSPLASGYGDLGDLFAWNRVPGNLRNYLVWLVDAHTPVVLCGVAAILLPLRRLWPWTSDRTIFFVIDVFVIALWMIYCAWLVFDTFWFTRFLLSSWPFIMLGVGAVASAVFRMNRRVGPVVVCSVIALGIIQLRFADAHGVFDIGRGEHRNIVVAQLARRVTEPNSVTISLIHSGSVRYYGGRMTLNYAWLDGNWLDRAVDWLANHGVHTYALLEDWEMPEFRRRFAGARRLAILDGPPLAMYADPGKLMIFDLSTPPSQSRKPIVVTGIDASWKAVLPASLPPFAFTASQ